ncbi:AbrB/MazE/SpoVT family DNA-binding domain-containing protein [Enterobacteriales bacterium SAP-6]|uniref:AbrB/MazE/SpoVT family DNA-binding domain-containing protein n=1 Tax=Acerihabitans arboris TaxID=2691583 RepID=A0A845STK7_9GAMM|nr:type II toxin-antitoxin system PrlF family antitoxin [Acerihabitans arboris]NDL66078.1 AbrB/MazE/SpoVT family DNA-binding domain-containing protein [Acerihabitans arboris]
MSAIDETATTTSTGQITLPKPIRHAWGVDVGGKVAFDLGDNGQVVATRVDTEHEDPVIDAFLMFAGCRRHWLALCIMEYAGH